MSDRVLVITKITFFDVDKLISTVALSKLLAEKSGSSVEVMVNGKFPSATLGKLVSTASIKFIEKLSSGFFSIRLPRGDAKVKEVKWEETADEIKLLVFTESGELVSQDIYSQQGLPDYKAIYTLGIKTQQDLEEILAENKSIWTKIPTTNIDFRAENTKYANQNLVYPEAKSYAETILIASNELDVAIPNGVATELLTSIYWKTNAFRNKYTSASTWQNVGKLIALGADHDDAQHKVFSSLSLIEAKSRQEIYQNLVVNSDKIAFSKVSKDTAQQLLKHQPITPNKNPLVELSDTWASFVFIPMDDTKTLVLTSYQEDKVNIRKLFGEYNYVGDSIQAEITLNMNVTDAEKKITQTLDQKVFNHTPKTEQTTDGLDSTPKPPTNVKQAEKVSQPELPPLAAATETITPDPAPVGADIAPIAANNSFADFGPIGGFGNQSTDPLPSVKN